MTIIHAMVILAAILILYHSLTYNGFDGDGGAL